MFKIYFQKTQKYSRRNYVRHGLYKGKYMFKCFPNTQQVTDRFHVQKLANEAVQNIRINYRWKEIKNYEQAKKANRTYPPCVLTNGDIIKQLLSKK